MNADELRAFIIEEIKGLSKEKLLQIENLINNVKEEDANALNETAAQYGLSEWQKLSDAQRAGLEEAVESLDRGERMNGEDVLSDIRKKFGLSA